LATVRPTIRRKKMNAREKRALFTAVAGTARVLGRRPEWLLDHYERTTDIFVSLLPADLVEVLGRLDATAVETERAYLLEHYAKAEQGGELTSWSRDATLVYDQARAWIEQNDDSTDESEAIRSPLAAVNGTPHDGHGDVAAPAVPPPGMATRWIELRRASDQDPELLEVAAIYEVANIALVGSEELIRKPRSSGDRPLGAILLPSGVDDALGRPASVWLGPGVVSRPG